LVSELIESADEQLLAKLEPIITLGLHHEQAAPGIDAY